MEAEEVRGCTLLSGERRLAEPPSFVGTEVFGRCLQWCRRAVHACVRPNPLRLHKCSCSLLAQA
jgi:hypothetical protein